MPSLQYRFEGYNRVKNSLRKLASEYKGEIDSTVADWAKEQRAFLKSYGYPSQTHNRQPFKTERQRRWFFWALANNIIQVPYKRTGRLANSWSAVSKGWANWTIENSSAYAHWVVGRDQQAQYHKGNWWIADDVLEEKTPELTKKLTEELEGLAK